MKKITSLLALFLMVLGINAQEQAPLELPTVSTADNTVYYAIKNLRSGKYAAYEGDANKMSLVDAQYKGVEKTLYYFTQGTATSENLVVKVNNKAANANKLADWSKWDATGRDWFIIKSANKENSGYAICKEDKLEGTGNAWNNARNEGKVIESWNGNDVNSTWVFELVPAAEVLSADYDEKASVVNVYLAKKEWTKSQEVLDGLKASLPAEKPTEAEALKNAIAKMSDAIEAYNNAPVILVENVSFCLKNRMHGTYPLFTDAEGLKITDVPGSEGLFVAKTQTEGGYKFFNAAKNKYVGTLVGLKNDTAIPLVDEETSAGVFNVSSILVGDKEYLQFCDKAYTDDNQNALHGTNWGVVVRWEAAAEASQWLFMGENSIVADLVGVYSQAIDMVGGYSNADYESLKKLTSLADVEKFLAANQPISVEVGNLYRFKNYSRDLSRDNGQHPGEGGYMSSTIGENQNPGVSCHNAALTDAGAIWRVVSTETEGQFKLLNLNNGKYMGKTTKDAYLQFADDADAGLYSFVNVAVGQYQIACQNGEGAKELHVSGLKAHVDKKTGEMVNGDPGVMHYTEGANSPSAWHIMPAQVLDVNMTEGWASLHVPFNVTLGAGAKAYTGKVDAAQNKLMLTEVQGAVPANNAVILNAVEKCVLTIAEATTEKLPNNELVGTNVEVEKVANSLVLGNGEAGIGMYKPSNAKMKINKAWVLAPAAKSLAFAFGEATGVENVEVAVPANNVYYDLSGRRVANPVKGIYILNGKKVYVK